MTAPMRIAILARTLAVGGAQRQIVELAKGLRQRGHGSTVLVMYAGGPLTAELEAAGVPVVDLAKRGRWDLTFFARLVRALRSVEPDVAIGFLLVQNVMLSLVKRAARLPAVVWSFRSSGRRDPDPVLRLVGSVARRLAGRPSAVIVNSSAGMRSLRDAGFESGNLVLVPNGVDVDRFRPLAAASSHWDAPGLPPDRPLVGVVARLDPDKDHITILRSAALLAERRPDVVWAMVGDGPPAYASRLHALARDLGLDGRVHWLGERNDMPAVYPAFDLLVLGSRREGFPNVVAEAMACGVPCVVTDCGDAATIVGATGRVVPVERPDRLAAACADLLASDRAALSRAARARVVARYSVETMVRRTIQVLSGSSGAGTQREP